MQNRHSVRASLFAVASTLVALAIAPLPGMPSPEGELYQRIEALSADGSKLLLSELRIDWILEKMVSGLQTQRRIVSQQSVWAISVQNGEAKLLWVERGSPRYFPAVPRWYISGDGQTAAFVDDNKLWMIDTSNPEFRYCCSLNARSPARTYYKIISSDMVGEWPPVYPLSSSRGAVTLLAYQQKRNLPGPYSPQAGFELTRHVIADGKLGSTLLADFPHDRVPLSTDDWEFAFFLSPSEKYLATVDYKRICDWRTLRPPNEPQVAVTPYRIRLWDVGSGQLLKEWAAERRVEHAYLPRIAWLEGETRLLLIEGIEDDPAKPKTYSIHLTWFDENGKILDYKGLKLPCPRYCAVFRVYQTPDGKYLILVIGHYVFIIDTTTWQVRYKTVPEPNAVSAAMTDKKTLVLAYYYDFLSREQRIVAPGFRYPWRVAVARYPFEEWKSWPTLEVAPGDCDTGSQGTHSHLEGICTRLIGARQALRN